MENKPLTFKYSSITISINPNINKNNLYLEIPINTKSNKYNLNASFYLDVINNFDYHNQRWYTHYLLIISYYILDYIDF